MATRGAARTKKRLTCTLVIGDSRLPGIVLDLSASGLFVQTSANPSQGSEIGLEIDVPGQAQRLALLVRVVRRKLVPPRLKSVVHAGLGLRVQNAPEAYYSYLAQIQLGEAAAAAPAKAAACETAGPLPRTAAPETAGRPVKTAAARKSASGGRSPSGPAVATRERFRVRVSQIGGSRSRSLEITAASEDEARREVTAECGDGWKILSCDRVG